jgi:ubiquinone/menaquinone biosynthesis C-methylase UbiE
MKSDPKDIVREGYDKMARQYEQESDPFSNENELDEFTNLVRPRGQILDAGCGPGIVARLLVDKGFQVTGVDISQTTIDIARQRVPEAELMVGDMSALEFDDETFDGIVSTYAVFHVPRTMHSSLFQEFRRVLKKGGALLLNIGTTETDGVWVWEEFQSVPMYWSYYPPPRTAELLESADFQIVFTKDVEIVFAGEIETHHWILAKVM